MVAAGAGASEDEPEDNAGQRAEHGVDQNVASYGTDVPRPMDSPGPTLNGPLTNNSSAA